MKKNKQLGFTLIELLIAIVIFSIIAIASYSSLSVFNKSSIHQQKQITKIQDLQTLMIFLDRDFSQIFNQELELKKNKIVIQSMQNDLVEYIYYDFSDKKITRINNNFKLVLMENIEKVKIKVLGSDSNKLISSWKKSKKKYPKAIEIKFKSNFGNITKLILINE